MHSPKEIRSTYRYQHLLYPLFRPDRCDVGTSTDPDSNPNGNAWPNVAICKSLEPTLGIRNPKPAENIQLLKLPWLSKQCLNFLLGDKKFNWYFDRDPTNKAPTPCHVHTSITLEKFLQSDGSRDPLKRETAFQRVRESPVGGDLELVPILLMRTKEKGYHFVLGLLYLTHDRQLDDVEDLPSSVALLELAYGLLAALSEDITTVHRAAVDQKFKLEDELKLLLSKEDVKLLKARKEHDKVLSGFHPSSFKRREHE